MPTSPLIDLMLKYRSRLDRQSSVDIQHLIEAYSGLHSRLKDKIDLLVLEMLQTGVENLSSSQVNKMARYKDLIDAIAKELGQYNNYVVIELDRIANASIAQSTLDIRAIARLYGITTGMNQLPNNAIKTLLGFLDPDGALYRRLQMLAPETAARIAEKILEGVAFGYGPAKVGRMILKDLGLPLSDAIRWARTTQMWTYREAFRATMTANADILQGWVWFAQLDGNTCAACLAEHGTIHSVNETLDGHWNCRCAMLPLTEGRDNPIEQNGEAWFNAQDEEMQKKMLGAEKWQAYKDGAYNFSELSTHTEDKIFGTMRVETPLWSLLGAEPPLRVKG